LRNWVRAVAIVDATNFTQEVKVFSSLIIRRRLGESKF
jgi:hypothetical protein